ncbi:NAD(P)/FAD-dependent oxidoreductase [Marinigracilibium pacificum]|uniref:NAD(P)/FAD-dependent oxidoreductase n=1 Tax=Marinigracilibium pacificum TaxID=2729599 RepID=A0A848ITR0_9BACT|nr:NAD(P)/FAD-dependent oxidoreductase [Marinigracilibium pacificum]NMM47873.1 NAD(P)/FAD-dependent oxidoreductase [Marinigracilibium pacificum]
METQVLIIGAGPSATVAAGVLYREGISVKIIEKEQFPRFVIGESLLPRCMDNFEKAGLLDAIKKQGFQTKKGAKFISHSKESDFNFSFQHTAGWSWTWQVKRADFDLCLANAIQEKGVEIIYNTTVVDVEFQENGSSLTTIKNIDGTTDKIKADHIIDASGYGRVLPRLLNLDAPSNFPVRTSLFAHFKDSNRHQEVDGDRIIIVVYNPKVWGWVIPFSDGTSSVGIAGNLEDINIFEGSPSDQLYAWINQIPQIKDRFADMSLIFDAKQITGYSKAVSKLCGKGFTLTGNAAEFLDPVFSSGVTFATESGALAASLIAKELKGEFVDWDKEYVEYIKSGVDVFRTFVNSWYDESLQKIIFSEKNNELIKNQICSVLAGYVWDKSNPFVKKHDRALKALYNVV